MKPFSLIYFLLFLFVFSCQTDSSVENENFIVEQYKIQMSKDPLMFSLIDRQIDFSSKVSYIYEATPKNQWEDMLTELDDQESHENIPFFLKNRNIQTNADFQESLNALNTAQISFIKKYDNLPKLPEKVRNEIWKHCITSYGNRLKAAKSTDCCGGMRGHLWGCIGGSTVILGFSWLTGLAVPALRGASWANDCIRKAEQTYGGCCH